MAQPQKEPVLFKGHDNSHLGTLHSTQYTRRETLLYAIRSCAFYWLLALVFLPIPAVHFIAVPLLLIAGLVQGYLRYRTVVSANRAEGICPHCKNAISFQLEPRERTPMWKYCPICQNSVQLSEASPGEERKLERPSEEATFEEGR